MKLFHAMKESERLILILNETEQTRNTVSEPFSGYRCSELGTSVPESMELAFICFQQLLLTAER